MDPTAEELITRLRRNPDDAAAYAALRAHYQRIGDWASLANLLEGWARRTPDPAAAAQAYFEAGELAWGALSDRGRGARLYEAALERNPVHAEAAQRVVSLLEEGGDMRRLAEHLEKRAEAMERAHVEPRDIAAIQHQLGEIYEHQFKRPDKAILHYRKAFELDSSLVPAIYAAREIYRSAGNVKAAATLCDMESKAEPDSERKVALLRELAHMRGEALNDLEGAVVALKRALGIAPGDFDVMADLARIYQARADQAQDALVADADRRRAADVLFQIAQKLPPADAVPHLESALDGAPDHDGALGLLETIAEHVGHFDLLPHRWVAYLARAPDAPGARERRKRLATAYVSAGQVDYAITCLEWLLEEGDADAAAQLVDLYRQAGRDDDVLRALEVSSAGLAPEARIPKLRELVELLLARGDHEGAANAAAQILDLDPADAEALAQVEDHCRRAGDWNRLRQHLLSASRVPGLSVDSRKQRLREVAQLSEKRLQDADAAISAWKGVVALDPSDHEARASLGRLLEQNERWDELVQVLERDALSALDPRAKADVYRRLAQIHREHRQDLEEAISALRNLRELLPTDLAGRDALCDALLDAGATMEAIPMLRQRIDESGPGDERAELLRRLAHSLEAEIGDDEGAFAAWTRLLEDAGGDAEALDRMEAIDVQSGNHERLVSTLAYRADIETGPERAALWARMGTIAENDLGDIDQAAEHYARALALEPSDEEVLDALCRVYDLSGRYRDLVVLLRERANAEPDPALRAALYRRIARTLSDRVGNEDAAAEAYREVLEGGDDQEALAYLRARALREDKPEDIEDLSARLAALLEPGEEKRDILIERATVLASRLDRAAEAIVVLRSVVTDIDPAHVPALAQLADLCEASSDKPGLADALWRTLEVIDDPGLRVPVAQRLADLHEKELAEPLRAIEALFAWNDADLTDPEPLQRLVGLLDAAGRYAELVGALDSLADLVEAPEESSALVRRAAEVSYRQLGDVDAAWSRLAPRVELGDRGAEEDLRELAKTATQGQRLFDLYVAIAEASDHDPAEKAQRWRDAAEVQEHFLGSTAAALEAVLKAFAVDLSDHSHLEEADRLAGLASQWERLAQVYEALIRRAEDKDTKVALLVRHSHALSAGTGDASAALDQALRACALAPDDDDVLAWAEQLGRSAQRADELLIVYDRRKVAAADDDARTEALLRAARTCDDDLRDRTRALQYLAQAVALSVRTPSIAPQVEDAARAFDRDRPEAPQGPALRGLVDVYAALAEDMEHDPIGGGRLLLRASKLLEKELDDEDNAFGALMRASTFAPSDAEVLDALESFAFRHGRLSTLDQHLARLVDDALDSKTAAGLLKRRGALLADKLDRPSDAAEVYAHLKNVAPDDLDGRARWRDCLRRSGRHQDLLMAIDMELRRNPSHEEELNLRKEYARTWERDLKNKWEAIEAWNKVRTLHPEDPEAEKAIKRLEYGTRKLDPSEVDDDSLERALADDDLEPGSADIHVTGMGRSEERSGELTNPGIEAPDSPGEEAAGFEDSGLFDEIPLAMGGELPSVAAHDPDLDGPRDLRPVAPSAVPDAFEGQTPIAKPVSGASAAAAPDQPSHPHAAPPRAVSPFEDTPLVAAADVVPFEDSAILGLPDASASGSEEGMETLSSGAYEADMEPPSVDEVEPLESNELALGAEMSRDEPAPPLGIAPFGGEPYSDDATMVATEGDMGEALALLRPKTRPPEPALRREHAELVEDGALDVEDELDVDEVIEALHTGDVDLQPIDDPLSADELSHVESLEDGELGDDLEEFEELEGVDMLEPAELAELDSEELVRTGQRGTGAPPPPPARASMPPPLPPQNTASGKPPPPPPSRSGASVPPPPPPNRRE